MKNTCASSLYISLTKTRGVSYANELLTQSADSVDERKGNA